MFNQVLFYGGLTGLIVSLVAAVIIYVKQDMGQVLGDLTGLSSKMRYKIIHQKLQQEDLHKASTGDLRVKKRAITDRLAKKRAAEQTGPLERVNETDLLDHEGTAQTELLQVAAETSVLIEEAAGDGPGPFFQKKVDIVIVHTGKRI